MRIRAVDRIITCTRVITLYSAVIAKMAVPGATSAVVSLLSDPATLVGLGAVAAGAAYYLATRPTPVTFPVPLDNQSLELAVCGRARCLLRRGVVMSAFLLCRREGSAPLDY